MVRGPSGVAGNAVLLRRDGPACGRRATDPGCRVRAPTSSGGSGHRDRTGRPEGLARGSFGVGDQADPGSAACAGGASAGAATRAGEISNHRQLTAIAIIATDPATPSAPEIGSSSPNAGVGGI